MSPEELEQLNREIRMVASGNAEALDLIYRRVGGRMYALARGIAKTREDAEDILSESFLKLARGARSFRGGNGYAFVMRVVRNTAFDLLRKRKVRAEEDIDAFFHLSDDRYSPGRREDALVLEAAAARLTQEEKRMIYYRYYLDLTVREIARETGMSKSAADRLIRAAEQKLREALAGQDGE